MPSRWLREGINTSERVDALTDGAEVFYRRLMSAVDDWGRYFAKPGLLLAACYPLRIGSPRCPTDEDIVRYLDECARARLVVVYEVEGKRYVQMLDFRQQTRAKVKKFPDPPAALGTDPDCNCNADATQTLSTCVADAMAVQRNIGIDIDIGNGIGKRYRSRGQKPRGKPVDNSPGPVLALLRDSGVKIRKTDPALGRWIEAGATAEVLTAAVAKAREYKPAPAAIPVPYLDRVVRDLLKPSERSNGHKRASNGNDRWWRSNAGIDRKARELGMQARSGESYDDLKARLFERLNATRNAA